MSSNLQLAITSRLPMIHVTTTDTVNVGEVLQEYAGEKVTHIVLPPVIQNFATLKMDGNVFFTSSVVDNISTFYSWLAESGKCVVFVNVEKSNCMFDGGELLPPASLMVQFLQSIGSDPDSLLPCLGGLTLKEVAEIIRMTNTRDGSLTEGGVQETRRGLRNLRGISQIDTRLSYYIPHEELGDWMAINSSFIIDPPLPELASKGLLFEGPPGTGKTEGAKFIAASLGIPLFHLDLGQVKGKYVGESEARLSAALSQVDQVQPCVLLLDEAEKALSVHNDSGVSSSLLGALLWWLAEHKSKVFTVMTTNHKASLPPELYREGRIDGCLEFPGISGLNDCYEFAKGVLDHLTDSLPQEAKMTIDMEEIYPILHSEVSKHISDSSPYLPQAKLKEIVKNLLRLSISGNSVVVEDIQPIKTEITQSAASKVVGSMGGKSGLKKSK